MNTKTIKFDLNKYKLYEKIKAKQGDIKSRFLLFQLLDGSIPFNLKNRSVRAYMIKPDGKEIFNDLIINNYKLGYCTLELTNQVLAIPGIVKIELMITEEERKLTSSIFELEVIKSINKEKSIVSTNEFTALLNGLAALSEYDNYKNAVKEMEETKADKEKVEEKFGEVYEQLDNIAFQVETKAQFDEAINKIKINGGGSIILKSNIVLYDSETIYNENLYMLEHLNYFKIIGNNHSLIFNDEHQNEVFYVFTFKNCSNIDLGHLKCKGQKNIFPAIKSSPYLCMLYENNKNVKVHDIEGKNLHGICGGRGSTHPIPINETLKSKNIEIYNITGDVVCYPFSFSYNCDNVTIRNSKFDKVHRGYFAYGVKNHKVDIEVSNFDATACLLNTYNNRGLENIKIKCISKNNSDSKTPVATKTVQIKFGNKDRAIVKNIDIELDVENLHGKVDNAFDITFDGSNGNNDNSGSHLLDGLKVSGKINGCVAGAISTTFYSNGSLENSTFKNIEIKNLSINDQGGNSTLKLAPLNGSCIIDNLVITGKNKRLYLTKNDEKECNIIIKNSSCGQITSSTFNNKATYQNCKFDDDYEFNFKNKILINTLIKDKVYNITNNLDNTKHWWNNFNNIFLFKEMFDFNNKTNVTFDIDINNINLGSSYSKPYLFNFNVYFRDTTYARMGVITGKILLKSNSQANDYLEYAKIIEQKFIPIGTDESLTSATLTINKCNKVLNLTLTTNNSAINDVGIEFRV